MPKEAIINPSNEISDVLAQIAAMEKVQERQRAQTKLSSMYPETGPYSRHAYGKHMTFFHRQTREALFLAANRTGKTTAGAYEAALHLTGLYPEWWQGRRFKGAVNIWAAGKTNETTRDIIQAELLGGVGGSSDKGGKWVRGTGMIPRDRIEHITWKSGVPDLVDTVTVRHISGGYSKLGLKTYAQGRDSFEGTAQHVVWFDEEPPEAVYTEALVRTTTTDGIIFVTFTPLQGLSKVVMRFLHDGQLVEGAEETRTVVGMTWDDVPHLDEKAKKELINSFPLHERDARTKGIPALGSGAIYPVPESEFVCEPFQIPSYWPKAYAMDVGWKRTAALWGAYDRENDTIYFYSEHYMGAAEPAVHAAAVRARGAWIQGVIDPASRGRSQIDGQNLFQIYTELGLNLSPADNAVESGIFKMWERLSTGRLKVFSTLKNLLMEYRIYRRDENGKIVKENDHILDCARYYVNSGIHVATHNPNCFLGGSGRREEKRASHQLSYDNYKPF